MNRRALILTPEPPYPLHSGGAYRTASLLHYFARIAEVDLIYIAETGRPALVPPNLVREQHVIPLRHNSRGTAARYLRNARRAVEGVPPLIDRLSGLGDAVRRAVNNRQYDYGVVEHFWCAPYIEELRGACARTILDLHNIESSLHQRCSAAEVGLQALGHKRFAHAAEKLEQDLLPQFDLVLTTSQPDADLAQAIAPDSHVAIYPNALPDRPVPTQPVDRNVIAFSGNFEYHPNIDAVRYFTTQIWPLIRQRNPTARVRLIGRGMESIRHMIAGQTEFEATGAVEDAFAQIATAAVVVAPLRAGSGTRIKILEAWAAARPVVATPLAAEGLNAQDHRNILLAEEAVAFAAAVCRLLGNAGEQAELGAAGRRTFEHQYTWAAAWTVLDNSLQATGSGFPDGYTG